MISSVCRLCSSALIFVLAAALAAGCGADKAQVHLCEKVVHAFEEPGTTISSTIAERHPHAKNAIMLSYLTRQADGARDNHWIACRFAGGPFTSGRLMLTAVTTDRHGALTAVDMAMLRIWLRLSGVRVLDPVTDDRLS